MMLLKKQVFGYNKSQVDELINEKDNVIVAIEPLSKGTKAVYQVNGRPEEVKVLADIPIV